MIHSSWSPPPNYQSIPPKVEGFTVYAPAPQAEAPGASEPVRYVCPRCGAATRFDVAAGGVTCESCGYTAPVQAENVGRRAAEFEFTLETLARAVKGWGETRREMHCSACGADLAIDRGALTVTCPFCASNQVTLRASPSDHLRPTAVLPFKVLPEQLRARAAVWLGKGWMHPPALKSAAVVDRFTGVYLPFWTFDAQVRAAWNAEVGHERSESYYDSGDKSWKTRTVIDWRTESGEVSLGIDDLLVSGTGRASRRLLEELKPFDLNGLQSYTPDLLAGWQALTYDLTLPVAWEEGKEIIREQAKDACYNDIHSVHVRNFRMRADFGGETWRYVLLPVYIAAYRFEDKVFQVLANGQTGFVAGQKPVDWTRVWLALAAILLPGLGLGLVGLPLLLAGGLGVVPLFFALVFLAVGGYFDYRIFRAARNSEAA